MSQYPPEIVEAARLLGVPQRALAAWVANYRRQHNDERRGRPARELDAESVRRALNGRSLRNAAVELGVPHTTLAGWLKRHGQP